jgi:hypothetical protein
LRLSRKVRASSLSKVFSLSRSSILTPPGKPPGTFLS